MTRKRYVKLMMSRGWSRNQANYMAYLMAYLVRKDNPAMTLAVKEAFLKAVPDLKDAIDEVMEELPDA